VLGVQPGDLGLRAILGTSDINNRGGHHITSRLSPA
jgi:hypothetical protein